MKDQQFYVGIKALITNSKGKILVLRKVAAKPSRNWKPFWEIPGGRIQNHEINKTLIREVKEEIGIKNVKIQGLFDVTVANFKINNGKASLLFVIYKCKIPANARLKLSKEHSEYRWVTPKEAKELLSFMLPKEFLKKLTL